jgi:VanZ family protein
MLKYFIRYKFSILITAFIAVVSLLPSSSLPETSLFDISYLDKIVHFGMYAFLGSVALLERGCPYPCQYAHIFLLMMIFLLSAIIEILQATLVVSRAAEWLDLLANFSGLVAAYFTYRIFRYIKS